MVDITIEPQKISAQGHAKDDAGCAAVSAILYALAGALENLGYPTQWRIESGCAEIPIPDSADARALHLNGRGWAASGCGGAGRYLHYKLTRGKDR